MNKQIIHDALVLTAFTLVIGVILGAVYGITKAPIDKANEQTKKEAYQAVFADASGFNQQEYDADAADKMVADAGYDDTRFIFFCRSNYYIFECIVHCKWHSNDTY